MLSYVEIEMMNDAIYNQIKFQTKYKTWAIIFLMQINIIIISK